MVGQTKEPRITLITLPPKDVLFTNTDAGILIASHIPLCAESIAFTRLTTLRIGWVEIPITRFASVTFLAFDVPFANASAGDHAEFLVGVTLTFSVVFRTNGGTVASLTNGRIAQSSSGFLIISRPTLFAVGAHRVMQTIVANAAGAIPRRQIFEWIEMASIGVPVAFASFASVGHATDSRHPRQVVVEILALLAIQAFGVVLTLAFAVDHIPTMNLLIIQRNTSGSVTVARA